MAAKSGFLCFHQPGEECHDTAFNHSAIACRERGLFSLFFHSLLRLTVNLSYWCAGCAVWLCYWVRGIKTKTAQFLSAWLPYRLASERKLGDRKEKKTQWRTTHQDKTDIIAQGCQTGGPWTGCIMRRRCPTPAPRIGKNRKMSCDSNMTRRV